jgi:hypothetical protein
MPGTKRDIAFSQMAVKGLTLFQGFLPSKLLFFSTDIKG